MKTNSTKWKVEKIHWYKHLSCGCKLSLASKGSSSASKAEAKCGQAWHWIQQVAAGEGKENANDFAEAPFQPLWFFVSEHYLTIVTYCHFFEFPCVRNFKHIFQILETHCTGFLRMFCCVGAANCTMSSSIPRDVHLYLLKLDFATYIWGRRSSTLFIAIAKTKDSEICRRFEPLKMKLMFYFGIIFWREHPPRDKNIIQWEISRILKRRYVSTI